MLRPQWGWNTRRWTYFATHLRPQWSKNAALQNALLRSKAAKFLECPHSSCNAALQYALLRWNTRRCLQWSWKRKRQNALLRVFFRGVHIVAALLRCNTRCCAAIRGECPQWSRKRNTHCCAAKKRDGFKSHRIFLPRCKRGGAFALCSDQTTITI